MPVHPKVKSATIAAAVSGVVVWLLSRYVLHGHVDATVTAEVYAVVPALLTFAAGWLTPAKPGAAIAVSPEASAQVRWAIDYIRSTYGIPQAVAPDPAAPDGPAPGSAAAETITPPGA